MPAAPAAESASPAMNRSRPSRPSKSFLRARDVLVVQQVEHRDERRPTADFKLLLPLVARGLVTRRREPARRQGSLPRSGMSDHEGGAIRKPSIPSLWGLTY